MLFSLGNGIRLRFWKDVWCREEALCDSFPSLFALATNNEVLVADLWNSSREEGEWIPHFVSLSIIGNWMRSFVFSIPYKERKLLRAKMT